ncbi:hypothetical protein ACU4GD_16730 [Cupriavidus basilensis]
MLYCAARVPAAADTRVLDAGELDTRCEAVLARLYARNPGAQALGRTRPAACWSFPMYSPAARWRAWSRATA